MRIHNTDPRHNANVYLTFQMESVHLATTLLSKTRMAGSDSDVCEIESIVVQGSDTISSGTLALLPQSQLLEMLMTWERLTIILVVGRRLLTSPSFGQKTAQSLGILAIRTASQLRLHEGTYHSCPHQLVSAMAGVLLVLGHLLPRGFTAPGPSESSQGSGDCISCFMHIARMLYDLAQRFSYARRVHGEFSTVISIISGVVEGWQSLSHAEQASHDYRTFIADMIGPDMDEMLPFQASCPPLRKGGTCHSPPGGRNPDSGASVVWLY
jgi:hypothetical protein